MANTIRRGCLSWATRLHVTYGDSPQEILEALYEIFFSLLEPIKGSLEVLTKVLKRFKV
jgi:hypothetical protein